MESRKKGDTLILYNYPYGAFAIEREQTPKKIKTELMPNLNLFQPKNHIWHININLIFLEFAFFLLQRPYIFLGLEKCAIRDAIIQRDVKSIRILTSSLQTTRVQGMD